MKPYYTDERATIYHGDEPLLALMQELDGGAGEDSRG
jgi:hypothetical protein